MDVKSAFLHGVLKETVYMKVSEALDVDNGNLVCKLKKFLYGLKQAPYCWNKRFNNCILKLKFEQSKYDACLYIKRYASGEIIYILLYVDDIILASDSIEIITEIKNELIRTFDMQEEQDLNYFLGISIKRSEKKICLNQKAYLENVLTRFGMKDCKEAAIPMEPIKNIKREKEKDAQVTEKPIRQLIGCLMYAVLGTRPDLSTCVNICSRQQDEPTEELWKRLKRILRYIKGTLDLELVYEAEENSIFTRFVDSDWAGSLEDRKSTTGYFYQVYGMTVCWSTRKQSTVVISSTKAEYIALAESAREGIWLSNILTEFDVPKGAFTIYEDNQSYIKLTQKTEHKRLKHVDVKFNFIKELVENKSVIIKYVCTKEQIADILTKNLTKEKFEYLRCKLGLRSFNVKGM